MWDYLYKMCQSLNQNQKLKLGDFGNTKLLKIDNTTSYLTNVFLVSDEFRAIGEQIYDDEIVRVTFNGFSKTWDNFVHGIVARDKLHDWAILWDDSMQEQLRIHSRSTSQKHREGEENVSLAIKGKKKFKKGPKDGNKQKGE